MPVYKDEKNGRWYAMVRYEDWKGQRKQKCKRGFATKREALEWERTFQQQNTGDLDMTFFSIQIIVLKHRSDEHNHVVLVILLHANRYEVVEKKSSFSLSEEQISFAIPSAIKTIKTIQ